MKTCDPVLQHHLILRRSSVLRGAWYVAFLVSCVATTALTAEKTPTLRAEPHEIRLAGPLARVQLVVTAQDAQNAPFDVTRSVTCRCLPGDLLSVSDTGLVTPLREGIGEIEIQHQNTSIRVPVEIRWSNARPASFRDHVLPALTKAGCNQGACHASQFGKGQFKLSVFGYDSDADYLAIARQFQQRRITPIAADKSLLLQKPTLQIPHGGGRRLSRQSYGFQALRTWIAAGAPPPSSEDPAPPEDPASVVSDERLQKLVVTPGIRQYRSGQTQQLRVVAYYRDQRRHDVTLLSRFDSLDDGVVNVTEAGHCTIVGPGQSGIMVRYRGQTTVAQIVSPYSTDVNLANWKPHNWIDNAVQTQWQRLGISPADLCSDAEFMRRAFLDCLGTLPTLEQATTFLTSEHPQKRARLVDEILGLNPIGDRTQHRENFSSYWTLKLGDVLRNNRKTAGDSGMWALHNWLKQALRKNKPLDHLARELITAQGSIFENGPVNYIAYSPRPTDNARVAPATDLAETTAQVFLGVRLQCARCHHHPFEVYSQADYYGLAAFFTRLQSKTSDAFGELGFDAVVSLKSTGEIRHPRTGQVVPPTPLLADPIDASTVVDLRQPLVDWLLDPQDRRFARSMANRIWGYLLGTGVVNPVDDMRSTNPPSNPELLNALAEHLVDSGYDLRQLLRSILNSRVYQLRGTPRQENLNQTRFYTHYNVKRLPAEVLLDAINSACGTREAFPDVPLGTRAIELPDPNFESYFLDTLGRPQRLTHCECERTAEPNIAQVLHLANGALLQQKLADEKGRITQLIKRGITDGQAIRELYLVTFSRIPSDEETRNCQRLIGQSATRREGLENILWALCNSREFLLNH